MGKYVELQDAYKSISEAIIHAGVKNSCKINVKWLHAEKININNVVEKLKGLKGIIVAPGFGNRGVEGKIITIKHIRENRIPFLGICLGMQSAVIEYSRNVLGLKDANSTEMDPKTSCPVIDLMQEQKEVTEKGGTMRLGAYNCSLENDSNAFKAYKEKNISDSSRASKLPVFTKVWILLREIAQPPISLTILAAHRRWCVLKLVPRVVIFNSPITW
mgnify:CR=1 FL=1